MGNNELELLWIVKGKMKQNFTTTLYPKNVDLNFRERFWRNNNNSHNNNNKNNNNNNNDDDDDDDDSNKWFLQWLINIWHTENYNSTQIDKSY